MLAKFINAADSVLMWGGLSIKGHNRYLQKAISELKLVKTVSTGPLIDQINAVLDSGYSVDVVRKLIRQIQNDPHFNDPLLSIGDGILTSDNITPLHRAWSFLIESIMEYYKSTLSLEQLVQLEVGESQRLLSQSEDAPLDRDEVLEDVKKKHSVPWFEQWRSIRSGIIFDHPLTTRRLTRYLSYHHYFTVDKDYALEEKWLDVWRLSFNKHFTNAPVEYGMRLISSSTYPYVFAVSYEHACVYDPTTHVLKELGFSDYSFREGKSPYYETEHRLPLGVMPKLDASRLYLCHAVIVREIATHRVWVEHIRPAQLTAISRDSSTPAYIFFSPQFEKYPNLNCVTGDIEVFVVDKENYFDKNLFLERVNPACTVKSLRVFRYNPKTSVQESDDVKLNYSVCYDLQSDSVVVLSHVDDHQPTIIKNPFSSNYPNLVAGKERAPSKGPSA